MEGLEGTRVLLCDFFVRGPKALYCVKQMYG